jgi:hypothetical protein
MSLPRRNSAVLGALVLCTLALAGCTPDDVKTLPTPEPTKTELPIAEPTEEPTLTVSAIVIDGDSVSVTISEGGTLVDIPFTTEPATAAAQLSEAIGLEPITSVTPTASCGGGLTKVTWGGISFWSPYASAPPGAQFWARADAKETSNGITVTMLGGQWVGFDGAATIAAYPGSELDFGMSGTHVLAFDVKSGTPDGNPDDFYGGIAVIQGDVVTGFSSPIHYYYDC